MCDLILRWFRNTVGRLTTTQKLLYVLTVLAVIIINSAYLSYVIDKVEAAENQPVTTLRQQSAFPFPAFNVGFNAIDNSNAHYCSVVVNWCRWCNRTDNECQSPPPPGVNCTSIMSARGGQTVGFIHVPGSAWVSNLENPSYFRISLSAVPSNNGADCPDSAYFWGGVQSATEKVNVADAGWLPSSLFSAAGGSQLDLHVATSTVGTLNQPDQITVTGSAMAVIQLPPTRMSPNTIEVFFGPDPPFTEPLATVSSQSIAYGWTDAVAAQFTILSASIGVISFLFPVTAAVRHYRLFVLDATKLVGDEHEGDEQRDEEIGGGGGGSGVPVLKPINTTATTNPQLLTPLAPAAS